MKIKDISSSENNQETDSSATCPRPEPFADTLQQADIAKIIAGGMHNVNAALTCTASAYTPKIDSEVKVVAETIIKALRLSIDTEKIFADTVDAGVISRILSGTHGRDGAISASFEGLTQRLGIPHVTVPTVPSGMTFAISVAPYLAEARVQMNRRVAESMRMSDTWKLLSVGTKIAYPFKFDLSVGAGEPLKLAQLPDFKLPKFEMPQLPKFEMPQLPKFEMPQLPKFEMPNLGLSLGLTERFRRWSEDVKRGQAALEESEYSFLEEFVTGDFALYLGSIAPSLRQAELADCMWRLTRSREFRTIIKQVFMQHPELAARWNAISQGLSCHGKGHHHAAVRTLLPEIEGVFTQILLARGEAILHGGKAHAVGVDGNVLRAESRGRFRMVELGGLGPKLDQCNPADDPLLQIVTERFLRQLPRPRNRTLHGDDASAGNQTFSTRLVWGLYVVGFTAAVELNARTSLAAMIPPTEARRQAMRRLEDVRVYLPCDVFTSVR